MNRNFTYFRRCIFLSHAGGILSGSTSGLALGEVMPPCTRGLPGIMSKEQLAGYMAGTGFSNPEIVQRHGVFDYDPRHMKVRVMGFCKKKAGILRGVIPRPRLLHFPPHPPRAQDLKKPGKIPY